MSTPYTVVRTSVVCPRCSVVLSPHTMECYNCGYRLIPTASALSTTSGKVAVSHSTTTSGKVAVSHSTTTSGKVAVSPQTDKRRTEQSLNKRAPMIYVITSLVVIVLFSYAGLHAAGFSLSSLTDIQQTGLGTFKESYPTATGTPLFFDSFNDDEAGWNQQSVRGSYTVSVGGGMLSLEDDKNSLLWEPLPGTRTFSDFQLITTAKLSKGDPNNGYGIYIRGAANTYSELASYYRFELYGDGSYAIFKGSTNARGKIIDTKLVNYTLSAAIAKSGGSNTIMIIARGSRMYFIVNNHLLQLVTDTSYSSGTVALFVSNLPGTKQGAQVQFSQLAIYPLQ